MCYGYNSDTARFIHKYDIYICDFGDLTDDTPSGMIAKKRPAIIISSDAVNNPKRGQYQVIPIRTEHRLTVNKDTVEDIVEEYREWNRLYIPIQMNQDDFRFADVTQLTMLPTSKINHYSGTIVNYELRDRLDNAVKELFFSEAKNLSDSNAIVKTIETVHHEPLLLDELDEIDESLESVFEETVEEKPAYTGKKRGRKISFAPGFSKYVLLYKEGKITQAEIAKRVGKTPQLISKHLKKWMEMEKSGLLDKSTETEVERELEKANVPEEFIRLYNLFKKNAITKQVFATRMGVTIQLLNNMIKEYEKIIA